MSETQPKDSYNHQFGEVHRINSFGGTAEYVDMCPEVQVSDTPVLVAGGWTVGRKASKQAAKEIYDQGKRVLLVDHARSGSAPEDASYSKEVLHKANTLMAVLDEAGVDKTDVIAHSEGALSAVVAGLMHPERFRNLVLVAPAGMIGEDSLLRLASGFGPKMARSISRDMVENPKVASTIVTAATPYILKNPLKSGREINSIAKTSISTVLRELNQAGIRVGLIQSNSDPIFPAKRIQEQVSQEEHSLNVDAYASVAWEKAGHDDLLIHPERTVRGALQMIEQFEKSQILHSPASET